MSEDDAGVDDPDDDEPAGDSPDDEEDAQESRPRRRKLSGRYVLGGSRPARPGDPFGNSGP